MDSAVPSTGRPYGCSPKCSRASTRQSAALGVSSARRISSSTTCRSRSTSTGSNTACCAASARTSSAVSRRAAGRTTWKYVQSWEVAAFISPPRPEIVWSITPGPREGVPLKSRCSMKCESPASSGLSSRAPARTQSWTAATSAASWGWSTAVRPFARRTRSGRGLIRRPSACGLTARPLLSAGTRRASDPATADPRRPASSALDLPLVAAPGQEVKMEVVDDLAALGSAVDGEPVAALGAGPAPRRSASRPGPCGRRAARRPGSAPSRTRRGAWGRPGRGPAPSDRCRGTPGSRRPRTRWWRDSGRRRSRRRGRRPSARTGAQRGRSVEVCRSSRNTRTSSGSNCPVRAPSRRLLSASSSPNGDLYGRWVQSAS